MFFIVLLKITLAIIVFLLLMGSQFAVLIGIFALGAIAIVKFFKNIKERKQALENKEVVSEE